ncbi:PEP-CTERM sorting domain-containing protein [Phenylobacterium sp.]|uniref:PEP-CTERM sorting domain-containing protein n=1 Tax=Phenylobacterium sp. TaxID=1871053 RepID=UPI002BD6302A|nr:PEP-CTERM sorting domain-containing protein [Phenylobacterium sp.]HLZ73921.1 PEP-CTERM sorting domain-containing protein [Phenylobacterium sp.]
MRITTLLAGAAMAVVATSAAYAGTPALSFSDTSASTLGNPPFTLGWQFDVLSAINVDALGVYDQDGDGLADRYDIGIWDNSNNLMVSATLGSGTSGTLIDKVRYVDVSPVTLAAGTYFIGALYATGDDPVVFPGSGDTISTISQVHYVGATYAGGGSLSDPTNPFSNNGFYGPDFTASGAVPEPAAWALMLTGFFGAGTALRASRRRTAVA